MKGNAMKCEDIDGLFAEYWSHELSDEQRSSFEAHVQSCTVCGEQFGRLDELWRGLPSVSAEEPGEGMRVRFYEALSAYRQGTEAVILPKPSRWWQQPVWQFAMAASLLMIGVGAGYGLRHDDTSHNEILDLRQEVTSMRQMVALSLLQQQSASERLRGVSWAYRAEPSNKDILSALVTAVNDDPNVNVRLAAVDALHAFAASPSTGQAAVESLPKQQAPLVQVALIDLLVDMKQHQASGELRKLASDDSVNDGVKQRALWALGRLEQ